MLPKRKSLPHEVPSWVEGGAEYFITICTSPRGKDQLTNAVVFNLIVESLGFRQDRGELWVHLLLLMPDHLHAIMSFSNQIGIKKLLTDWKRYLCVKGGVEWQRDFFDHRLRNNEGYIEKANYIRMNPVRAGLVKAPDEWPYIWENRR